MKELLTPEKLVKLRGRKIAWKTPIYDGNIGYYGKGLDGGIAIINELDITLKRPIVSTTIIKGTDPKYIFNEMTTVIQDHPYCFSDGMRYVTFEVLPDTETKTPKNYTQKLAELTENAICELKQHIRTHGQTSTSSQDKVGVINDENMMYNLSCEHYLYEVSENEIIDNRGYRYAYSVLSTEELMKVIDHIINQ